MSVPSEFDEMYSKDAQDVNDPVWETDANIAVMREVDDPNDETMERVPRLRTADGEISFLNALEEVLDPFLERDRPGIPKKPALDPIRTRELGADKWRGRTATVTASSNAPMLDDSPMRRAVMLVNLGEATAYISSVSNCTAGAPNTFPLLASTATLYVPPITLPTRDDVYAVCAAGLTTTVGIIELFDMEP